MRLEIKERPREFDAQGVRMRDYGKVHLEADEMIAVVSASGKECDVTAKDWGFYLAPSLNARLRTQGFKVALVMNRDGKLFINAVEIEKMDSFKKYLVANGNSKVVRWLDECAE